MSCFDLHISPRGKVCKRSKRRTHGTTAPVHNLFETNVRDGRHETYDREGD